MKRLLLLAAAFPVVVAGAAGLTGCSRDNIEAINLAGGMIDWAEAGRPMVGDGAGDPLVV